MSGERVSNQHFCSGAWIQQTLVCRLEETLVWIKARLEKLVEELPKDTATIYARLIQTVSIEQMDSNPFLQVWF